LTVLECELEPCPLLHAYLSLHYYFVLPIHIQMANFYDGENAQQTIDLISHKL